MRIKQIGDASLRQVSQALSYDEIFGDEVKHEIARMKSILDGIKAISDENGNALSAPQVGFARRLILLRIDGDFVAMINPVFSPIGSERFDFEEECFSLYHVRATVSRWKSIQLEFVNQDSETKKMELHGEFAGLVQHEIDHLNGILFTDHVTQKELVPIEESLKSNPQRLQQVKQMIAYMKGQD